MNKIRSGTVAVVTALVFSLAPSPTALATSSPEAEAPCTQELTILCFEPNIPGVNAPREYQAAKQTLQRLPMLGSMVPINKEQPYGPDAAIHLLTRGEFAKATLEGDLKTFQHSDPVEEALGDVESELDTLFIPTDLNAAAGAGSGNSSACFIYEDFSSRYGQHPYRNGFIQERQNKRVGFGLQYIYSKHNMTNNEVFPNAITYGDDTSPQPLRNRRFWEGWLLNRDKRTGRVYDATEFKLIVDTSPPKSPACADGRQLGIQTIYPTGGSYNVNSYGEKEFPQWVNRLEFN